MKLRRSICLSFLTEAPVPCVRSAIAFAALGLLATGTLAQNVWTRSGTNDWYGDVTNWSQGHFPLAGENVVITNASVGILLTNAAPAVGWLSSFMISNTSTLIFSNWNTTLSATNVTIQSNGVVTLPAAFTTSQMSNNVVIVCSNLIIAAGGSINANSLGYNKAATAGARGYGPGAGYGYGGAGYGGAGGCGRNWGGLTYGSASAPTDPGSSGGNGDWIKAGAGGGAVHIQAAGAVVINGTISAKGANNDLQSGSSLSGAGSGGSIYIVCNTFTGTNGSVVANGGRQAAADESSGGGGGGRIAVVYDTNAQVSVSTPNVLFSAAGGYGYSSANLYYGHTAGDAGTLYFPDSRLLTAIIPHCGQIVIPNFTNWSVASLTISNGWLRFPVAGFQLTVAGDVTITGTNQGGAARLEVGGTAYWSNRHFRVVSDTSNAPSLNVGGNLILTNSGCLYVYGAITNASTTNYGARVSVTGNVSIASNCWLYPFSNPTNGGSALFSVSNFTIASGGGIDAAWKGFANKGIDSFNTGYGLGGGFGYGAAGYGGLGGWVGRGSPGFPYGSTNDPIDPGSAGGVGDVGGGGGDGAGLVRIRASDTVTVNGMITANGQPPYSGTAGAGGGSGGGISIACRTLQGSNGTISAEGGTAPSGSTGGGGGRIAVNYDTNAQASAGSPAVRFSVAGGSSTAGGNGGDLGTLYFPDTQWLSATNPYSGQWIVPNFTNWAPGNLLLSNVWVRFPIDGFQMSVAGNVTIMSSTGRLDVGGSVTWTNGRYQSNLGGAAINSGTNKPVLTVGGNLTLTNGGSLYVYAGVTNGLAQDYGVLVSVAGDMVVASNCWVYPCSHSANGGSALFRVANLTLAPFGGINANAKGFNKLNWGYNTLGLGAGGGQGYVGGGYGGVGGKASWGSGGVTYGSSNAPVNPGSAGGMGDDGGNGGVGGGAVRVQASGTVRVDGLITANGQGGSTYQSGGAGGGIYISAKRFASAGYAPITGVTNGVMTANGGNCGASSAGGGGGRIAIWRVSDLMPAGPISNYVNGASSAGGTSGSNGTVVWGLLPPPGAIISVF